MHKLVCNIPAKTARKLSGIPCARSKSVTSDTVKFYIFLNSKNNVSKFELCTMLYHDPFCTFYLSATSCTVALIWKLTVYIITTHMISYLHDSHFTTRIYTHNFDITHTTTDSLKLRLFSTHIYIGLKSL